MASENNAGYYLAVFFKVVIAVVVALFLGIHSVNFFSFVFPADQQLYAYLGFGLTGGAIVAYIAMVKWGRLSPMSQAVALVMLMVSVLGELAAAGFGMRIEAQQKAGFGLTSENFDGMVLVVQGLGLAHAVALVVMLIGDDIKAMFRSASVFSYSVQTTPASVTPGEVNGGAMFREGVQNEKISTSKR